MLRALGQAGEPEIASRLAARAWWIARRASPELAAHINGVMHYLATLPDRPTHDRTDEEHPMPTTELDVRSEPPARRHEMILSTYDDLGTGDGFVLVNDHAKPLYYQFAAEHTEQFTWDYLESGPDVWRVRIGRPEAA